jgi:hypothetical protein
MVLQQIRIQSCSMSKGPKFSAARASHFQPSGWKQRIGDCLAPVERARFSTFCPSQPSGDVRQRAAIGAQSCVVP